MIPRGWLKIRPHVFILRLLALLFWEAHCNNFTRALISRSIKLFHLKLVEHCDKSGSSIWDCAIQRPSIWHGKTYDHMFAGQGQQVGELERRGKVRLGRRATVLI